MPNRSVISPLYQMRLWSDGLADARGEEGVQREQV